MIDKLSFHLGTPLAVKELTRRAAAEGYRMKLRKLSEGWHLTPRDSDNGTYFRIQYFGGQAVRSVQSRPSAFKNHKLYLDYLTRFLTPDEISQASLVRLDLAVDYGVPFQEFIAGLDIQFKQSVTSYTDRAGTPETLNIGKGSEVFTIYNKALQQKIQGQVRTRLEVKWKGEKLPTRSIDDLPRLLLDRNGIASRPFRRVVIQEVRLQPLDDKMSRPDLIKHTELRTLLASSGYFATRRRLNRHRNFNRDYRGFILPGGLLREPDKDLRRSLEDYFREPYLRTGSSNPSVARSAYLGYSRPLTTTE